MARHVESMCEATRRIVDAQRVGEDGGASRASTAVSHARSTAIPVRTRSIDSCVSETNTRTVSLSIAAASRAESGTPRVTTVRIVSTDS